MQTLSKPDAKEFDANFYEIIKPISKWNSDDIFDTLHELKNAGFLKMYITSDFSLNGEAIVYMENRFKNGLSEVTKYLADLFADIATGLIL